MIQRLFSPIVLLCVIAVLVGSTIGLGMFTFDYAKGTSYMGNDSATCANCHVMQNHFDAWVKSSHGKFAQCNDCHSPHDPIGKSYCKSRNGFFHSLAFTTGDFPDQIRMHNYNRRVVEQNCRNCHEEIVHAIGMLTPGDKGLDSVSCLHCHNGVGHKTR